MTNIKIVEDAFSKDTFSINLKLWYCGNDISLVKIQFFLSYMTNKKIMEKCLLKRHV